MDSVNHLDDGASLLRDVTRLYTRAQRETVACCGTHSAARCHVLGELSRSGRLRLTELAARLDADKSWTSRTVTAMAAEGLLSCCGSERDARVVEIELTRKGRATWAKMDAELRQHARSAFAQLSAEERRIVHRGLELLRQVLEDGLGPAASPDTTKAVRSRERPAPAARRRP